MAMTQCDPSRIDKILDEPFDGNHSEILQHLDDCKSCRNLLNEKVASELEWKQAGKMLQPQEYDKACSAEYAAAGTTDAMGMSPTVEDVLKALTPTDDPHRLGRLGVYEVSGVIGVGGMGVVLKAVEPALDRVVAIKVLSPNLAGNDKARRRFAREARAAAAVLHPNVIPIYSVANQENLSYLVMAYVPGGSLQKRVDQQGPFPVEEILRIGMQIASGLAASHSQGLVHRDIKPENVLLEGEVDRVTITDFGLARAVDDNSLTQVGTIAGTPMYMSPEQARGEQVDHYSDLFSLGSVLYALCTGEAPFRADNSYSVMRKIIEESPTPIRDINPDIPEWLESIIERLMARKKTERFETADELYKVMERYLSHVQQPDTVPLPDALQPKRYERQTNLWKTGLLTTVAVSLIAVVSLVAQQFWPDPSNTVADNNESTKSSIQNGRTSQDTDDPPVTKKESTRDKDERPTLADLPQSDFAWMLEELMGEDMGIPKNNEYPDESLVAGTNQLLDMVPDSRERLAQRAVELGRPEVAKILLFESRVDSAADEAMKLGNMLVAANNAELAVDAYLDAFRIEPILFRSDHVALFEEQERLAKLAAVFTVERLGKTRGYTVLLDLLNALMNDNSRVSTGIPFLKRLSIGRPDLQPFLGNISVWEDSSCQLDLLRARWIPENLESQGGGWDHLCRDGVEVGWYKWLAPASYDRSTLQELIENESTVRLFLDELDSTIQEHKNWAAGKALVGILEAHVGNYEPAKSWIEANLSNVVPSSDATSPELIPAAFARIIGERLEGKDDELDRLIDSLYDQADRHLKTTSASFLEE